MQKELRDEVWQRAAGVCEYCRMPQAYDPIVLAINLPHRLAHREALLTEGVLQLDRGKPNA